MKHKLGKAKVGVIGLMGCTLLLAFAACGEEPAPATEKAFEGIKDVHVAKTVTEYDFEAGITALENLEETPFTVDSSEVVFGTAGEYTVTYSIGSYKETCTVYVYGDPEFTQKETEISYADIQSAARLKSVVSAKDTFGGDVTVTLEQGISVGALGYVEYGSEHTLQFSAKDKVGNVGSFSCTVTVTDEGAPSYADIGIDLADTAEVTQLSGVNGLKIFENGVELGSESYTFINGYLTFTESYILGKELGEYALTFVTSAGYDEVTLTVEDKLPASFKFGGDDCGYADKIYIQAAELLGNQRNIQFAYTVTDDEGNSVPVTTEDEEIYFQPKSATKFTVTATAMRGETEAGFKSYVMNIHDDVYAWTVNAKNDLKDVYIKAPNSLGEYNTEIVPEGYSGSYRLYSTEAGVGNFQIQLQHTADVERESSFSFFIYNPTGVELQASIFTTSGYWTTSVPLGGVLSNYATITGELGWQKVTLTLKSEYDGTLSGMTAGPNDPTMANTEIRINTADWLYDGEKQFEVYLSNIYLERAHTISEVEYVANGHVSLGAINTQFSLPYATSEDARFVHTYKLVLGGNEVDYEKESFAFVPTQAGEYEYTITSTWRGQTVGTETYTFTVSDDALVLAPAAYYQYDEAGKITLPAATVVGDTTGKVVEYSVTDPVGVTTVLGADRTYDTGKVHGEYTYKVAIKNGTTEEEVKTAKILVHDGKVLVDGGLSNKHYAGLTVDTAGVAGTLEFTTEEAAPGELGSMKVTGALNSNQNNALNVWFNLNVVSTEVTKGHSKIYFYVKHNSTSTGFMSSCYSTAGGWKSEYTWNGNTYTDWQPRVLGDGQWHRVEVALSRDLDPSDPTFVLNIGSDGIAYDGELTFYVSNIYYV